LSYTYIREHFMAFEMLRIRGLPNKPHRTASQPSDAACAAKQSVTTKNRIQASENLAATRRKQFLQILLRLFKNYHRKFNVIKNLNRYNA